jgi:uncharacterized membrane protein YhdT
MDFGGGVIFLKLVFNLKGGVEMDFVEFLLTLIIATIIFTPIDKRYRFRSKYHNLSNKKFRLFIFILGLLFIIVELFIAFLSGDYLKSMGLNRDLISFIFEIPLLFVILVCMPFTDEI